MGSSAFSWLLRRGGGSAVGEKSGKGEGKRGEVVSREELEEFGVTEQLREFVRGLTYEANVQKDLTEWQEQHALLILSRVKEISEIRYVLCPRHLKDKDFWAIYFLLVKKFVAPYELRAIQKAKLKMMAMQVQESTDNGAIEVEMTMAKPVESTRAPPTEGE
ncbi:unnamed protein product [Spirodela intermedia]|uniref:BSD domain-containing protein n=1 Tax=Spirodela intermedia TaxID=51605 RepID=A0A7I8IPY3_SPIIN|nr:unnamed protein product [Spirodela intermedia]CAA6659553.1 unnamed protein product [Spirodela intermedia]